MAYKHYRDKEKRRLYLRKYMPAWRKRNRASVNRTRKRWTKKYPEKIRLERASYFQRLKQNPVRYQIRKKRAAKWEREWKKRHPRLARAKRKRYRISRKLKLAFYQRQRDARRRNAPGRHSFVAWMQKVERFHWKCAYCGKKLTKKTLTKDHVIPISKGGSDWLRNVVPCCRPCNERKQAKVLN